MKKRILSILIMFSLFFTIFPPTPISAWIEPAIITQPIDEFSPFRESEHFLFDLPSGFLRDKITPEQLGWYLSEMDKLYEALAEFVGGADNWLPKSKFDTGDPRKIFMCYEPKGGGGMSAPLGYPLIYFNNMLEVGDTLNNIRNEQIYWAPVHELGHVFGFYPRFSAEWLADFLMMYVSIATGMMYSGPIQEKLGLPAEPTLEGWYQREFNWQNQTGIAWWALTMSDYNSRQGTWLNMAILNFAHDYGWEALKRTFGSYHDSSYPYAGQWYEGSGLEVNYHEFIDRIDYFSGVNFRSDYLESMGWLDAIEEEFPVTVIGDKVTNPPATTTTVVTTTPEIITTTSESTTTPDMTTTIPVTTTSPFITTTPPVITTNPVTTAPSVTITTPEVTASPVKKGILSKKGRDENAPTIFCVLEILKYLIKMDGEIKSNGVVNEDRLYASLLSSQGKKKGEPTIFDALEILKHLVGMVDLTK